MHDRDLYQQILGLRAPWRVADVRLDMGQREVVVLVRTERNRSSKPRGPVAARQ